MSSELAEVLADASIRVAAHELRSPIAVAQTMVRGVLGGYAGEITEMQADILRRVSHRLDFMEEQVDDLLDLAAGQAAVPEEETAVTLNSSVERVVSQLRPRAEGKGVDLVHRTCGEGLMVRATEEGLDRLLTNLVENAIKYAGGAGKHVWVETGRSQNGPKHYGWVRITDDGPGIPAGTLPHLFDRFYRADEARARSNENEAGKVPDGSGLGLSIVQWIAKAHSGEVVVKSEPGSGASFEVRLPLAGTSPQN